MLTHPSKLLKTFYVVIQNEPTPTQGYGVSMGNDLMIASAPPQRKL